MFEMILVGVRVTYIAGAALAAALYVFMLRRRPDWFRDLGEVFPSMGAGASRALAGLLFVIFWFVMLMIPHPRRRRRA